MSRTTTTAPGPRRGRRAARKASRPRGLIVAVIAGVMVVAAGAAAVVILGGDRAASPGTALAPRDDPAPAWVAASAVLDDTAPDGAPQAGGAPIADVLAGPLSDSGLGDRVGMTVVDLATGQRVFGQGDDVAQMPASTTKLLTATAALAALGPDHTFTTMVTAPQPLADDSTLTLVGGGDPLLGRGDGASVTSLGDLAAATVDALTEAGVTRVRLAYDDTMFSGPAEDPDWEPDYVAIDVVAPTVALTLDRGRIDPDGDERTTDPAGHAAQAFADLLSDGGIDVVDAPVAAASEPAAEPIAQVRSAPLRVVVEHTLDTSDNDAAEVLMRHVALARGLPGTSEDGSAAVLAALTDLGVDVSDVTLADGSGLARGNRIPAAVIAGVLTTASSAEHPELRAAVTGLPVAGFTGTLAERWDDAPGAGVVRAKTGTLTGTSALAGVVESVDGHTFVFAVVADEVGDTVAARAALDDVAGALSTCGCVLP